MRHSLFITTFLLFPLLISSAGTTVITGGSPEEPPNVLMPNVLMIVVDDLNDWTGGLDGHPQANTPNLDRLASMGTRFTNAHCQGPRCGPSRVSFMWGMRPMTTQVFNNNDDRAEAVQQAPTIMQYFRDQGYRTLAGGKIFHHSANHRPSFEEFFPMGLFNPKDVMPYPDNGKSWNWGPQDYPEDEFNDYRIADWAIGKLREKHEQPIFLAVGFVRPHVPNYAPRRFFEALPMNGAEMPPLISGDWEDIPEIARGLITTMGPDLAWFQEDMERWRGLVTAYLAATSFMDAQLGRVLDALEASDMADNTIILLFSDHGLHLGEKEHFGKYTMWERSTRVPFLWHVRGLPAGQSIDAAVELIDVYPTLCALADLPIPAHAEGRNLLPLLQDASADWNHAAFTTLSPGNHSLRHQHWRYTIYQDGSEELYDLAEDPNEWTNLASDPARADILNRYRTRMHAQFPGSTNGTP